MIQNLDVCRPLMVAVRFHVAVQKLVQSKKQQTLITRLPSDHILASGGWGTQATTLLVDQVRS